MFYAYLADAVVIFHLAVLAFVVLGQLAIVLAAPFKWQWARNPYFRLLHIAIIGYVVYEQFADVRCFLTVWEEQLKNLAGVPFDSSATFLGRFLRDVLYLNLPNVSEVYIAMYVGAFVVVLQGWVMYPPRMFRFGKATPVVAATPPAVLPPAPAAAAEPAPAAVSA